MTRNKTIVTLGLIALVSVAFMGCSDDSDPVAVTPTQAVDTAPPAVPSNLSAEFDGSAAILSWDENSVDADLAGFLVEKEHYDNVSVLIGIPSMVTSIVDNDVQAGISTYHVTSVDVSGNESAYATIQVVNAGSKTDYVFGE